MVQAGAELVRDKETLLAAVAGCKEATGAYLDYVQLHLYKGLQEAVAAQVCCKASAAGAVAHA